MSERSIRAEVGLMLLDKLGLALALAFATFIFSCSLQKRESRFDYQKDIFEKRRLAYEEILAKAKGARDELMEFYWPDWGGEGTPGKMTWNGKLKALLRSIQMPGLGGGGGDIGDLGQTAVASLNAVVEARQKNELYISRKVDLAMEHFLNEVVLPFKESVESANAKKALSTQKRQTRAEEVANAFLELKETIRQCLMVDDMVLGLMPSNRHSGRGHGMPAFAASMGRYTASTQPAAPHGGSHT